MHRLGVLLLFPLLLSAGWTEFRSGPFDVVTDAGDKEGRRVLAHLEQLRHVLGTLTGKPEMRSVWTIRIVVFKNAKDRARYQGAKPLALARNELAGSVVAEEPVPHDLTRAVAKALLEANTAARMPVEIEDGLLDLVSTLEVRATRVTLGTPPPPEDRSRGWARVHMLATRPEYSGKVRVLLFNMQQGADAMAAYKNAFEMTPTAIDKEVQAYIAAGKFEPVPFSGRPIDPERQFHSREVEDAEARIRMADLLLSDPAKAAEARAACQAIANENDAAREAHECLGILAVREGDKAAAKQELEMATGQGNRSARAWLELAKLSEDPRPAAESAIKLNPRWAEPHRLLASKEANPAKKAQLLKTAAELVPRDATLWRELAETYTALNQFSEAAHAWSAAERASPTLAEREAVLQARRDIERRRVEHDESERRRAAEEEARELKKLQDELEARVRAAEQRANAGGEPAKKVEEWFEGPKTSKVQGTLQSVDCRRGQARLMVLTPDSKTMQLLVRDPKDVVIIGGGVTTLGCGPQRPPRRVSVEYLPKTPPEVKVIEFQP